MKKFLFALNFIFVFSAAANEINLKPGLYEVSLKITVDGKSANPVADLDKQMNDPAMKEMMARMSPENKAKMMKALEASSGKATKQCIKQGDLSSEKIMKGLDKKQDCKTNYVKKTATEMKAEIVCKNGDKGNLTFKTEGTDKFSYELDGNFNGQKNTKVTSSGKLISSTCP